MSEPYLEESSYGISCLLFLSIKKSIIGYYWERRASVIVPGLWAGVLVMVFINQLKTLPDPVFLYSLLVFFTGLFIGGVYNNVAAAITVELGRQPELLSIFPQNIINFTIGSKKATSTVTSLIVGYGSIFASFN